MRFLVGSIIDQPDDLRLFASNDGRHDLIEVRVAASDLPNVIGRGGKTAQSLRAVLDAWTYKHRLRAHLRILEEDEEPKGTAVGSEDAGSSDEDEDDDSSPEAADE
ncbi:MAG: KH domain-containing protein [Deltaproteobacteria bacterium]|nr:KH domain-containing protein [Deltaproteobacteria bacterium]